LFISTWKKKIIKKEMKIYTKKGDDGTTSLGGCSDRFSKSNIHFHFLGDMDELNSHLGFLICLLRKNEDESVKDLVRIQNVLFDVAAFIAYPSRVTDKVASFIDQETEWLESEIDKMTSILPPLRAFILPSGDELHSSYVHVVRSSCRRAERSLVSLSNKYTSALQYINRLSDYFFTLARRYNEGEETLYVSWQKR
jgi:cob(I)alamin adenosyltransferase